ncbi:hypothetical protein CK203_112958 [Vitis vinifera]|uniref:Uncharacterized protein n=1 Tax=Vitis vinifera TaxID=29760 RepID=A0A438EB42_VITVI|nr:hypothetical protein CK203_112958 [Vitis vinifera]
MPGHAKPALLIGEDKRKEGLLRKAPGGKLSAPSPAGAPAKKKGKVTKKGKEVKIPTPPKEFVCPPITYKKEVTIKEPENPLSSFISSGPGHVAGLNHSGSSLSAAARLAILAEEAASINTPDSPHPDADAGEAVRADASPLMATPMEEMGAESQGLASCEPSPFALVPVKGPVSRRSSSARNLKSGLIGWLQDCFQETIEVGCSSVQDDHPEGSETEMATETPAVPVVVPDEGTPGETHPAVNEGGPVPEEESPSNASSGESLVDDAACISADSFSYAELEEKLKWIPPGSTTAMPSAKMFEVVETRLRGMVQQHDLFTDLLRTADYMKAFASQRKDSENQLRLTLEEAEASLSTARGTTKLSGRIWLRQGAGKSRWMPACMRRKMRWLSWGSAKKKKLEGEFAAEREELEADYQKQVMTCSSSAIAAV